MAESDQPKKETVRIELPLPPVINPPQPMVAPRETVYVQLPVHETERSPLASQSSHEDILSTDFFPPPNPPVASKPVSVAVRSAPALPCGTEERYRSNSSQSGAIALFSKEDAAADRHASGRSTKSAHRCGGRGEKLDGAVLAAYGPFRINFDYPDLDLLFLAMENSAIINLNESNFDRELTQDDKPLIVDFWAEWCGPCKMIAPLLDEVAREKAGAVKIAKVNVDDNQSLSSKYNIRAIPALLFFKNGQLRDQVIGVTSKKDLLNRLEALG